MIFSNFYLFAANNFYLSPPIFRTFPFNEISPVIPKFYGNFCFKAKLKNALVMAIPADGPSLGTAPSGK